MSRKPVPAQAGERARIEVLFDKPQLLGRLFGEYDQNLIAIESRLGAGTSVSVRLPVLLAALPAVQSPEPEATPEEEAPPPPTSLGDNVIAFAPR